MKKINSMYIAGLFNTDGNFSIHFDKSEKSKFKYKITAIVTLTQHKNSKHVLEEIKQYFQYGYINKQAQDCYAYKITNRKVILEKIIPFFEKNNLIFFKSTQYEVWKNIVFLLQSKYHLSASGFNTIVSILYCINRSPKRKSKLESIFLYMQKTYGFLKIVYFLDLQKLCNSFLAFENHNNRFVSLNKFFVTGLIDGDGGFSISFRKNKTIKPSFYFSNESEDAHSFVLLQNFFKGGKIYKISKNYYRFMISDHYTLLNSVCAHFKKN